jgi:DNA-nicking Smr family endonuclease
LSGKRTPRDEPANTDPDTALFREAVQDVKPIRQPPRASAAKRKPPARARFTAADRALVLVESLQGFGESEVSDSGDEISFRRDGVQDRVMRKLKRGEYRVEDVCDLHGLTVEEAKAALRGFLAEALARHLQCVRIIHGKGKGSGPKGPVIKTAVNMILRKTAPVLAFTSARRIDGGTGAINVLLST